MSKKTFYVASTLSTSVDYPVYVAGGADLPQVAHVISIKGGANIQDKFLRAPDGAIITPVSAEEVEALRNNSVFNLHMKNGFVQILESATTGEKAAADMEGRDQSAPLVDEDFAEGQKPVVNEEPAPTAPAGKTSRKA